MSQETESGCLELIFTAVACVLIGFCLGIWIEDCAVRSPMRAKAVELGAATWVLDPKTGKTEFAWIDPKSPNPPP